MPKLLQYNGRLIDFDKLDKVVFDVDNICQSMVKVCRFNGQTKFHYSNLRHCFMVSCVCPHEELKLACLLHDVHESVIGDFCTPVVAYLEQRCPEIKKEIDTLKCELDKVIARQFNCPELLDPKVKKIIKYYDQQMTNVEAHFLINNYWTLFEEPEIIVEYLDPEPNWSSIANWRNRLKRLMRKKEKINGTENNEATESGILATC